MCLQFYPSAINPISNFAHLNGTVFGTFSLSFLRKADGFCCFFSPFAPAAVLCSSIAEPMQPKPYPYCSHQMSTFSITYPLEQLQQAVVQLQQHFPQARIFTLTGELGAGKTTLVSEFCRQLGVMDKTSSPTFSIVNEYAGKGGPVYHLDCYRLKDLAEAFDIGIEDYLDQGDYCFIEWPQIIEPLLPSSVVNLRLHIDPNDESGQLRTLSATTPTV